MAQGPPTVVIAAGGTGGHIYPGLALAEAIAEARPDARIEFVGTPKGLEGELVPAAGHRLHLYDMVQFAGQGWRKGLVPLALGRAAFQARRILKRADADVAVSMGGYSGIPLILAARTARIPSLIHEPGAVPGKANLLAARFTDHLATSFPQTRFSGVELRHVGYPLRRSMTSFDRAALRPEARAGYGLDERTAMVLVTGGSQGAMSLNRLALGLAERWAARDDVRIVLKAGARNHAEVEGLLAGNPGAHLVELVRYIDRMDHAYAAADLGVFRSGAGTVAELAVVELPSVLVPFPHDEHDEQVHNAQPLVDAGGALLVRDHEATAEHVGPMLEARMDDRVTLAAMSAGMRASARPHAAADLARWVLDLAEGKRSRS
jgi:UDP-N-acetylglucosamine--N-acetylmuramyl-(pentapeptide) pyrophosphoryl-undecaprenol N-acetylglucosamine transferase